MKIDKGAFPVKLETVGLDEPPLTIDISICLPEKKVPDETKRAPKPKNTIALF
jgi:hypothetical protein